jgi:putative DNA methylase
MVNDPGGERGYYAGKTKAQADKEREDLFQIIRELVKWENYGGPLCQDQN